MRFNRSRHLARPSLPLGVLLLCWLLAASGVHAADRVALVIGNAEYRRPAGAQGRSVPPLANASNDARAVAKKLRTQPLGFEVIEAYDLTQEQMADKLTEFGQRLMATGKVGFFYYAGHGAQVRLGVGSEAREENLLMGVDVDISTTNRLEKGSLKLSDVLSSMRGAGRAVNVVVLDACRDNPALDSRGSRGLAPVGTAGPDFLIQYATAANQTAADGPPGSHGAYTRELLAWMDRPGLSLADMFTEVAGAVKRATRQEPWMSSTVGERIFLAGGQSAVAPAKQEAAGTDTAAVELAFWKSTEALGTRQAYRTYLQRYPAGQFKDLAELKLKPVPAAPVPTVPLPAMVEVAGGSFEMGSPSYEEGRDSDEGPVRGVQIKGFRLGKYEVTRGEYLRFTQSTGYRTEAERDVDVADSAGDWAKGPNPGCYAYKGGTKFGWKAGTSFRDPGYAQGDDHPVVCVSWNDALAYVEWLNRETGRRYRLPSEAEQEYAIRASSRTAYAWGTDVNEACAHANVGDASAKGRFPGWTSVSCDDGAVFTSSVGRYGANALGLHDTVGNALEWSADCYVGSYEDAPLDGSAVRAGGCERRVLRGASWLDVPSWLRSANRLWLDPTFRDSLIGFRLAEDL